jgi:hypothetical protein
MMQVWLYNLPGATPTLIVGLTFAEIRQLLEDPLSIFLRATPTPEEIEQFDEGYVRVPMDVYFLSTRTTEDIDNFYATSKSVAPVHDPVWHTAATSTADDARVVLVGLSFDDLGSLIENPLEFRWEIEGKHIGAPFNIVICSGETREEMTEWFLKKHSITRAPVN